jgi:hypothetical protein
MIVKRKPYFNLYPFYFNLYPFYFNLEKPTLTL